VPERARGRSSNGAVLELLKVLLRSVAETEGVAPKIIATVDDLEAVALDDAADVPVLKGWRRELFGNKAVALKGGRLSLAVEDGRVVVQPTGAPPPSAEKADGPGSPGPDGAPVRPVGSDPTLSVAERRR
jgi:ribonuclease D